jgi:chromosome transmission fidelity protein 18
LAKLRPHAYQIRFNRPADVHIVKRLKEVCEIEGLKADSRALSTLVSVAKGDLRGCLNTLQVGTSLVDKPNSPLLIFHTQFIKTRNEDVSEAVIRRATSGMKEADTTVHSVLNDLFTPLTKKRTMELGLTEEEESRYVHRLSRDIEGAGRDSAIATGMYRQIASEDSFFIDIYVQAVLATTPRFVDMTLIFRDTNKASNG